MRKCIISNYSGIHVLLWSIVQKSNLPATSALLCKLNLFIEDLYLTLSLDNNNIGVLI